MLVLSRKQQQQIKIGDQITVTIVKVKGNTVRVGIEAPRDVRVIRAELPKESDEADAPISLASVALDVSNLTATEIDASDIAEDSNEEVAASQVISFRVRCELDDASDASDDHAEPAFPSTRSAAHLPVKRLHDRFGNAPLRQILASATLAK